MVKLIALNIFYGYIDEEFIKVKYCLIMNIRIIMKKVWQIDISKALNKLTVTNRRNKYEGRT